MDFTPDFFANEGFFFSFLVVIACLSNLKPNPSCYPTSTMTSRRFPHVSFFFYPSTFHSATFSILVISFQSPTVFWIGEDRKCLLRLCLSS